MQWSNFLLKLHNLLLSQLSHHLSRRNQGNRQSQPRRKAPKRDAPVVPSDQPDPEDIKKELDSVKQEDDQADGDVAAADQVSQVATAGSVVGDQRRIMTPADAIAAGSTYLVVGRPITGAEDPAAAAVAVQNEVESALT